MQSFSKVLSKTNVEKQLSVPSYFAAKYLPLHDGGNMIYLPVHDVSGNVLENFGYYTRKIGTDYAKPVFQQGWRKYVREKNLSPGDMIIFRVETNGAHDTSKYTIAARKKKDIVILGCPTFGWESEC